MTDDELQIYVAHKQYYFSQPEVLSEFEDMVNRLCLVTECSVWWRITLTLMFEFLCFTIHTSEGRAMYLRLLTHIAPYCPDITEKYWAVFDKQENLINRYKINIRI